MDATPPAIIQQHKEILRDKNGHKTGIIYYKDGVEKVYDSNNHYQGQYRESDNITRDKNGHKIGSGNQLTPKSK